MTKLIFEVQAKIATQQPYVTKGEFFRQENAEGLYNELQQSGEYVAARIRVITQAREWKA
jgi:hypothetical protein